MERLLYRLGRSKYAGRFILKGAMLFTVWSGRTFRLTKDIDLVSYGKSTSEYIKMVFTEIVQTNPDFDDGIIFLSDEIDVHPIREEQEYGGQRIVIKALLGNANIRLQVDVAFGDIVTPAPEKIIFPTILDMPAPEILIYNKETVIAEKFHIINVFGIANSRMKDYYDLWILSKQYEFDGNLLIKAIRATFERRKNPSPQRVTIRIERRIL